MTGIDPDLIVAVAAILADMTYDQSPFSFRIDHPGGKEIFEIIIVDIKRF